MQKVVVKATPLKGRLSLVCRSFMVKCSLLETRNVAAAPEKNNWTNLSLKFDFGSTCSIVLHPSRSFSCTEGEKFYLEYCRNVLKIQVGLNARSLFDKT